MALDILSYEIGKQSGGGSEPTGTINITENGITNVSSYATADVNVQPDLESKEITITSNTTTNVTPTTGKDGLSQVSVITNVQPNLETKSVTITENTTTTITPTSGKDGLSSVEVITNVSGGDDWSDIGYSSKPEGIDSIHAYSKSIYDNWNPNNTSGTMTSDKKLIICPNVDVSNVSNYSNFFQYDSNLIQVPALNVIIKSSSPLAMYIFSSCENLEFVDFSNWDISEATNLRGLFTNCKNMQLFNLSSFDTRNVTFFYEMFQGCSKLTTIIFGNNFTFESATNLYNMFNNSIKLDNDTLNQILYLCTTVGSSYTRAKTLAELGITSSFTNFANIPNLSNYQDFIDAGWTIS